MSVLLVFSVVDRLNWGEIRQCEVRNFFFMYFRLIHSHGPHCRTHILDGIPEELASARS